MLFTRAGTFLRLSDLNNCTVGGFNAPTDASDALLHWHPEACNKPLQLTILLPECTCVESAAMASLRTATSVHHSVSGRRSCDLSSSSHLTLRPRRSFQAVHAFQSAEASQPQPAATQQQQNAADSSSNANNNIDDNWWHYQRQVPWWQKRPVVLASGKCISPRPKTRSSRKRAGITT